VLNSIPNFYASFLKRSDKVVVALQRNFFGEEQRGIGRCVGSSGQGFANREKWRFG